MTNKLLSSEPMDNDAVVRFLKSRDFEPSPEWLSLRFDSPIYWEKKRQQEEVVNDIVAYIVYKDRPSPNELRINMWSDIPTHKEIMDRARTNTHTQNLVMLFKLIRNILTNRMRTFYQSSDYVSHMALVFGLDDLHIDHFAYVLHDKRKKFYAEDLSHPNLYSIVYEFEIVQKFIDKLNGVLCAIENKDYRKMYTYENVSKTEIDGNSYFLIYGEYKFSKHMELGPYKSQTWAEVHSYSIKGKPKGFSLENAIRG